MTDQHPENNRELHELLGKCWHEEADPDGFCTCGDYHKPGEWDTINPNYASDPRLVLEAMKERNSLFQFLSSITFLHEWEIVSFILDRTGRLRDLAIEFLKDGTYCTPAVGGAMIGSGGLN